MQCYWLYFELEKSLFIYRRDAIADCLVLRRQSCVPYWNRLLNHTPKKEHNANNLWLPRTSTLLGSVFGLRKERKEDPRKPP